MNVRLLLSFLVVLAFCQVSNALMIVDTSAVRPGEFTVSTSVSNLQVGWSDRAGHRWEASFSLDASRPRITSISADGKPIVQNAEPVYRCSTGTRVGGWDAFFDFPPNHPEGTRNFMQVFEPKKVVARSVGNRLEVSFDGMSLGIFKGNLNYVFYPGSSLIQQVAVMTSNEPDVTYYYDAGLRMTVEADRVPGINMASSIAYYDSTGHLQQITSPYGSERHSLQTAYRAVAAKTGAGSIVAFPAPHRYIFARDYTTNLGYSWYSSWRGQVSLGIQQPPDDNTAIYPWINAPPGTAQEMGMFLLLSTSGPVEDLNRALDYTHRDRFPHVSGFVTFAPHWHLAYTEQAIANVPSWQPPFKQAMQNIGLDSVMIMDFHIDGHPSDLTAIRPRELAEYYKATRSQSNQKFLAIPAEEADVILGGHWGLVFPKPVYWYMDRKPDQPFKSSDTQYGTLYRVHTTSEMWQMIKAEGGYAYQTHPRTKGSTGYPDKILSTEYFRDRSYLGVGWKAMPSDLSSPRLGERAFKTLDDLNNFGLHKIALGEVDVFQVHPDDDLYTHMNVNYVRMPQLPDFDHYGRLLDSVARGDGFISTGEITFPSMNLNEENSRIHIAAEIASTFPLQFAELVWGDGVESHRQIFDLKSTREFDTLKFDQFVDAPNWTWARFAVWDVAADGAFTNPLFQTK